MIKNPRNHRATHNIDKESDSEMNKVKYVEIIVFQKTTHLRFSSYLKHFFLQSSRFQNI